MQPPAIKVFSERARESALRVRRHQSALGASEKPAGPGVQMGGVTVSPAIAARVREILASKTKGKKKAGGKGKADAAKKKAEAAAKKAERDKERATAKQEREKAKAERVAHQAQAKQERDKAKAERVAAQAKKQQAAQAKLKQAAQAKKQKEKASAQAKGDKAKQVRAKQAEREKAAQAKQAERTAAAKERLAKSDAAKQVRDQAAAKRQAESDAKQKQASDRKKRVLAERIKRGEKLSASDQVDAEDAGLVKAGKAMIDPIDELAIKSGARHSKMDMDHIQGIHDHAVMCGANCDPGEETEETDDTDTEAAGKAIKGIMDDPGYYAQHECGDIMQAANALSTLAMLLQSELAEDDEDDAHITLLCDAARTLVKFISAELDELEGAAGDAADTARMGPMNKADDTDYLHIDGGAVKALDDDNIRGYAVLFGDADHPDLQKDYFTKSTDFWLDHWGWPKPITYHHGMDAATRDDPVVGHWKAAGVDDVGVWMEGQIDRAHAYYKAMKELAARGYLRLSSDSAPQWVIRDKQSNGVNSIKRWPLVTSSLTVTPMEPRMLPVEVKALMAELGLEAIDTDAEAINPDAARSDETKAADDERARVILLELDLLELETA